MDALSRGKMSGIFQKKKKRKKAKTRLFRWLSIMAEKRAEEF